MLTSAANPFLVMKSIFWILTICKVIHGSAEGSEWRLTRRSTGSVLSSQQAEPPRHQSSANNRSETEDQKSDPSPSPSSHSIRLLPPPDMILDSFLNSPRAQHASQRIPPPKELIDNVFQRLSGETSVRNSRRLPSAPPAQSPPPLRPMRQPLRHQRPSHRWPASPPGDLLRNDIVSLMPPLDQLQKHVIPIDAISKDIESAIQKIVEDIVNRREKVFYQMPNSMYDKPAPVWETRNRHKKKQRHGDEMREERRAVQHYGRPPARHVPPPPAAHRGLYSAASSGNERPAGNELLPYYAIAQNGLGPGLKSLAEYVKSLRHEDRASESENEGYNYIPVDEHSPSHGQDGPDDSTNPSYSTTPVSTFMIEIPDGLELPVPDPSSPVTPALIRPYETKDEELTLLHSDWIGVHSDDSADHRSEQRRPERAEGGDRPERQRDTNGYQQPAARIESGSGSERSAPVASSADQANLSTEQIRINKEVLLPFFESILGESNNRIGVYIPQPSLTTSLPSSPESLRSQQPAENHSSLMRGGVTTATTSYSSGMTGIRKKKPCPGK